MEVPAFLIWLKKKYPLVTVDCLEKQAEAGKDVDSSVINPNGLEFHNLYIDMNGLILPCTHPENKPAPRNEDEIMLAIFEFIDRLFKIVRPRKLLYLAVDGVAPRAKMQKQRSKMFRTAKEMAAQSSLIRTQIKAKGVNLHPENNGTFNFNTNCITPGTSFMSRLTECLNYYIHARLNSDPGWRNIKVILSDASVPGEGKYKLFDFIRRQRAHNNYDPNIVHCLYGGDADTIMLGLATHEPYFYIIREEFVINPPKQCDLCGIGHKFTECKGQVNDINFISETRPMGTPTRCIFIRLNVLREYLAEELKMPGLPFKYDFEHALDDWVFLYIFVENNFLPHLPSLKIQEGALDKLISLYKKTIYTAKGFFTYSGNVNLKRLQLLINDLNKGSPEDRIFKIRYHNKVLSKNMLQIEEMVQNLMKNRSNPGSTNFALKDEPKQVDEVKLWESGYKERYYELKFNIEGNNPSLREKICSEYIIGLCWVLKYYYQGCASWKWYYPYHYAPFASDFKNIASYEANFRKGTQPLTPLEHLMSVSPTGNFALVPTACISLMTDPLSPILDFYPMDYIIDSNEEHFTGGGVALLPLVDEARLRKGLASIYKDLSESEVKRDKLGHNRLYMGMGTDCFSYIKQLDPTIYQKRTKNLLSDGVYGNVHIIQEEFFPGRTILSPVSGLDTIMGSNTICVAFDDPQYPDDYVFRAMRHPAASEPPRVLNKQVSVNCEY